MWLLGLLIAMVAVVWPLAARRPRTLDRLTASIAEIQAAVDVGRNVRGLQRAPPHPDTFAEKVRAPLGWQGLPAANLLDQVTPAFAGDGGELHAPAWRFLQERPPESREQPDRAGAQPPACS
jgi:hypothetical protein